MSTTKVLKIEELQPGDIIWDAQRIVVTEVRQMSASTVVWGRDKDAPAPPADAQHGGGNVQWLLGFGYPVLTTRTTLDERTCNGHRPGEVCS